MYTLPLCRFVSGKVVSPGTGSGEQSLGGVSVPAHLFGCTVLCSARTAPLHLLVLMLAQGKNWREGTIFPSRSTNHT